MSNRTKSNLKRQWPGRKIARISWWYAAGYNSREIAALLNDGTSHESVRHEIRRWQVVGMLSRVDRPITSRVSHSRIVQARKAARKRGMELGDLISKIVNNVFEEGDEAIDILLGDGANV